MRINCIRLFNIGSYLGEHEIPLYCDDGRNIVLVGGKNGAGKTTLFEAIKLCLYGIAAYGYEYITNSYTKRILRMMSGADNVKKESSIELDIELEDGLSIGSYAVCRRWSVSDSLFLESFSIRKGEQGEELSSDEIDDFKSYLFSVMPPAILDIFFFDGEHMAERFIGSDGSVLRDALLTVCGFDSLYIMRKNFARRVKHKKELATVGAYLEAKHKLEESQAKFSNAKSSLDACDEEIHDSKERLKKLEKDYAKKGGVTEAEWQAKLDEIKLEEKKKDGLNAEARRLFVEELPFVILRGRISELSDMLVGEHLSLLGEKERADFRFSLLVSVCDSLGVDSPNEEAMSLAKAIEDNFFKDSDGSLLRLSAKEMDDLKSRIKRVMSFDKDAMMRARRDREESVKKLLGLRREIEACPIERVREYSEAFEALQKDIDAKEEEHKSLDKEFMSASAEKDDADNAFRVAEAALDEELRGNAVISLSERGVLLMDRMLDTLTASKRKQIEELFLEKLSELNQKEGFVSRIEVDSSFNVHCFLKDDSGSEVEVDAMRFSKGEKQIFIMSFYWVLMKLSRISIPFLIDTPFARIDTTHRERIAERFFSELSGQAVIFSTDEEFVGKPLEIISGKVGRRMLLENADNKETVVVEGEYFG